MKYTVDVNEGSSQTVKLLSNIESLLKEQNELLRQAFPVTSSQTEPKKEYKCKICGATHENKGQLMTCYKKHKKERK